MNASQSLLITLTHIPTANPSLNLPFGETTDHDLVRRLVMVQPTINPFFLVLLALCLDRVEEQVCRRSASWDSQEFIEIEDSGFAAEVSLGPFQEAWLGRHKFRLSASVSKLPERSFRNKRYSPGQGDIDIHPPPCSS